MRLLILVLGLVCLPAVAGADRIHLDNGKVFDDVIVLEQSGDTIRFRVASGEMRLPLSWVARVEKAPGALEDYLERKESLLADSESSAQSWLQLARWARTEGVGHGFREALIQAGELEPALEGLAPLMASIDYARQPESGVWSPRSSVVAAAAVGPQERGRGYREVQSEPSSNDQVAQGLTRAIERLAEAELERTRARGQAPPPTRSRASAFGTMIYPMAAVPAGFAMTGWVFRGEPLRPADSDPRDPVIRKPRNPKARALLARPPGSLLPLSAYED